MLRSLGFVDAQVRGSVLVHSLATTLAALVVGIPLGVVAGRLSWRAFAGQLGVLSDSARPGPRLDLGCRHPPRSTGGPHC